MGELVAVLDIGTISEGAFVFTGVVLEGAAWAAPTITLTDTLFYELPAIGLRYVHNKTYSQPENDIQAPVYLNATRTVIVTSFGLPMPPEEKSVTFLQRGIALLLWYG